MNLLSYIRGTPLFRLLSRKLLKYEHRIGLRWVRFTPCIVNVGLPRTGTTSFTRATELLGFKSLHIWESAEHDPVILAGFRANKLKYRDFVAKYHTLSDTPFYALRDTFEHFYPETLIVYTTRPKQDWIRSMLNYQIAGGQFLANLYGLKGIPYTETDASDLERLYDLHHAITCRGLPSIDIGVRDDRSKWELLCSALPNPDECLKRSRQLEWPHENSLLTKI